MDRNFQLQEYYIPTVRFSVPRAQFIPPVAPEGRPGCLSGTRYYVSNRCGSFSYFSAADIKTIIRQHGGTIRNPISQNCTYVIGNDPSEEFLAEIREYANTETLPILELFENIRRSVDPDTDSNNNGNSDGSDGDEEEVENESS